MCILISSNAPGFPIAGGAYAGCRDARAHMQHHRHPRSCPARLCCDVNANFHWTCIATSKQAHGRHHVHKQQILLIDPSLFIVLAVRTTGYVAGSPRRAQAASRASNLQRTGMCKCLIHENEPPHRSTDLFQHLRCS